MEGIDLNFAALAAVILNVNLSTNNALKIMGIGEQIITKKMAADDFTIKKTEIGKIRKLYNEGATLEQLSKIYNTSAPVVGKFMKNNGIQARTRGKRKEGDIRWQSC